MGIYIKGMELPTSCRACRLKMNCDECEGWECVCVPLHQQIGYLDDLLTDKRRDDCPLGYVPPNGRLGDLDKLADNIRSATAGMEHRAIIMHEIRRAPTIIPAEEGE